MARNQDCGVHMEIGINVMTVLVENIVDNGNGKNT